jgi:diadenosine tetraphosphatase ApaH/serine/threonine PP2A family protein phosphatase
MLIALLADIHANLEALEACLAHAAGRGATQHIVLGDIVGYGADPLAVTRRVAALGAPCLLGNHDEAALGGPRGFNPEAAEAARWTATQLDEPARAFLRGLPLTHRDGEILYVHADASAPTDWRYVDNIPAAARSLNATDARFVIAGHTHVPLLACAGASGKLVPHTPKPGTPIPLGTFRRACAVLGAVGQPRDRNPAACYGLLDTARMELAWMRVPYDVAAAAGKIRAAGLPERLAARLFEGG